MAIAAKRQEAPVSTPARPQIEFADATLALGGKTIIEDLSLGVRPGEFLCIVGASGCGKTTALRLAAGLYRPTRGAVTFGGQPMREPRREVAIVFQEYGKALLPWRTAAGNVSLALEAVGTPSAERPARIDALLRKVGLPGHAGKYPTEMSGGMQQRLQIARCSNRANRRKTPRDSSCDWMKVRWQVSAIIPVAIAAFGLTQGMALFVIAFGAIWPIMLATVHGFAAVEPRLHEVARSLQISKLTVISRIALPSASPDILAGMRLSLTVALILSVVCKILAGLDGLGHWLSARAFRSADLFAGSHPARRNRLCDLGGDVPGRAMAVGMADRRAVGTAAKRTSTFSVPHVSRPFVGTSGPGRLQVPPAIKYQSRIPPHFRRRCRPSWRAQFIGNDHQIERFAKMRRELRQVTIQIRRSIDDLSGESGFQTHARHIDLRGKNHVLDCKIGNQIEIGFVKKLTHRQRVIRNSGSIKKFGATLAAAVRRLQGPLDLWRVLDLQADHCIFSPIPIGKRPELAKINHHAI